MLLTGSTEVNAVVPGPSWDSEATRLRLDVADYRAFQVLQASHVDLVATVSDTTVDVVEVQIDDVEHTRYFRELSFVHLGPIRANRAAATRGTGAPELVQLTKFVLHYILQVGVGVF